MVLDIHVNIASLNMDVSLNIHITSNSGLSTKADIHTAYITGLSNMAISLTTRNLSLNFHIDSSVRYLDVVLVGLGLSMRNASLDIHLLLAYSSRLLDSVELDTAIILLNIDIGVHICANITLVISSNINI